MKIIITKGKNRNTLHCIREDGSSTKGDLGPDIPYHDLAHFVVESKFKLQKGFYGNIKSGMSIAELSDKEVIKTLGAGSWLSEIMARNLQAIASGAATIANYNTLVLWEMESIKGGMVPAMSVKDIECIKSDYDKLCEVWEFTPENGQLTLEF